MSFGASLHRRFRMLLALSLIVVGACGDRSRPTVRPELSSPAALNSFKALMNQLLSRPSFHLTVKLETAPADVSLGLGGTFEVDFQQPDRVSGIHLSGEMETGRYISINDQYFTSADMGRSWSQMPIPPFPPPRYPLLTEFVEQACGATGESGRLHVELADQTQSCGTGPSLEIVVQEERIATMTQRIPTDTTAITFTARVDYERVIDPIVPPPTASVVPSTVD